MRANAVLTVGSADEQIGDQRQRHAAAVYRALVDRRARFDRALARMLAEPGDLAAAGTLLLDRLSAGHTVLTAGNGGSAAEAQHFAAELVGRFKREREPYAVLALTADSATVTAVANDYGYAEVFARQVRAFGRRGDVLVGFSTSGGSENVVRAAQVARRAGMSVIAVTGARRSRLSDLADVAVCVPEDETPIVQELHTLVTHLLCDFVETELAARPLPSPAATAPGGSEQ